MLPRVPPTQRSPHPGSDHDPNKRTASRDLISQRRRGVRYGDTADDDDSTDRFLTAGQVRARYGHASDMWLWRRPKDNSGFPPPLDICGRRYWRLSELIIWERACARTVPPIRTIAS
jgi:hypothetical protein